MEKSLVSKIKCITIVAFVAMALVAVKFLFQARVDSVESLQSYVKQFGAFAPVALTLFQAFQVIVPVLPGYLGCAVGAVAFGSSVGFWCNYIGISLGSVAAYFLAKRFGKNLVLALFSETMYDKWSSRLGKSKGYGVFLFLAMLLPLFPDDFLCYFSGLMRMDRRKYIWIIILGKPWCILVYSIVFGLIR